ncbi:MAG: ABC transporter permease, partial [Phycisphaerales bacterium]
MSRRSWARRVLAGLNPVEIVRGIPGAVFHKEIAVSGRRVSTYVTRGLFVAAPLGFAALVTSAGINSMGGAQEGPAARLQQFQSVAPGVTMTISWCAFIGLTLVAVSRGGSSIADERRMGTLGALMTTPLRAWQIVLGKTLSILVEIIILGLATAPLLLAVRAFGGVSGVMIVQLTALTLARAALACIASIFWSVSFRKSGNAMISGLLLLVLIEIGPPLLGLLVDSLLERFGTSFAAEFGRVFGVALDPLGLFLFSCTPVVFQWSMAEL